MNNLDRLDWILWKQRDVVHQVKHIKEYSEAGKPIKTIGEYPEGTTPQGLINFQKERYSILEQLKLIDDEKIKEWLESARGRITGQDDQDFYTNAEIRLIEECLNKV